MHIDRTNLASTVTLLFAMGVDRFIHNAWTIVSALALCVGAVVHVGHFWLRLRHSNAALQRFKLRCFREWDAKLD